MKAIVLALVLSLAVVPVMSAETKRVCVEQKDQKTGKTKEVCKEVKVHKKLDGTKVPDKK